MRTLFVTLTFVALLAVSSLAEPPAPSPTPPPTAQLNDALAEMIRGVTQTAGEAKGFLVAELPDVVRQLLVWHFVRSLFWTLASAGILIACLVIIRRGLNAGHLTNCSKDRYNYVPAGGLAKAVLFWVSAPIGLLSAITLVATMWRGTWLQIWLAPKVYLVEYARDFLK